MSAHRLHLRKRLCHGIIFGERPDARPVRPGGVAMTLRLRPLVIDRFHGEGEITHDLVNIRDVQVTAFDLSETSIGQR
jgi:hypothetical protein